MIRFSDEHVWVRVEGDIGVVESVKAASDVFAPVGGEVTEVNEALHADPSLVNSAPLTLIDVLAWAAATVGWAIRNGAWFGRPRIDGRPG